MGDTSQLRSERIENVVWRNCPHAGVYLGEPLVGSLGSGTSQYAEGMSVGTVTRRVCRTEDSDTWLFQSGRDMQGTAIHSYYCRRPARGINQSRDSGKMPVRSVDLRKYVGAGGRSIHQ